MNITLQILEEIKKRKAEGEIFSLDKEGTRIDFREGKIETQDQFQEKGFGLRIFFADKVGFAFASSISNPKRFCEDAFASLKCSTDDIFLKIPSLPQIKYSQTNLQLFDNQFSNIPFKEKVGVLKKLEDLTFKLDKRIKKTERISYQDIKFFVSMQNSAGIDKTFSGTQYHLAASVIAEDDNSQESGFGIDSTAVYSNLNIDSIALEAVFDATSSLSGKTVPTNKTSLVLLPKISVQFLAALANSFSGETVSKEKSLLKNKLGKKIASSNISIIDDGLFISQLGSRPFDDEGIPQQKTILVEKGILKSYLHNSYSAAKMKTFSTGNAGRMSYRSAIKIKPTNFYLTAETTMPLNKIISQTKSGILVTKILGMHTVNTVSGDFSLGAAGTLIENGKTTKPVRGIAISGNLFNFIKSISAVGDDLKFYYLDSNFGAPSLLVEEIMVGGT
jgi:PmbA protein